MTTPLAAAPRTEPTPAAAPGPALRRPGPTLDPVAWGPVAAISASAVAFHLATSALYGLHRDEFYYLAAGNHPAWGYVDQPPVTPMLYRLSQAVFGHSIVGLHVLPAICAATFIVVGALLAREVGGGRRAQVLTAVVAAIGPMYIGTARFLSTVTPDLLIWAVATLLVLRLIRTAERRLWVPIGTVVGIGLLNKYTVGFWVIGMGIGLLATPERRLLRSRWFLAGVAVAAALVAPNVVWQADHGWASFVFMSHLRQRTMGQNVGQYLPIQLGIATMAGVVIWVAGLRWMLRDPAGRRFRALGVAFPVVVGLIFVLGGKGYYAGAIYLPVVAAGAVVVERRFTPRQRRRLTAAVLITGAITVPLVTPLVPKSLLPATHLAKINPDLGGMLGWHDVARQLADVDHALPAADQRTAVILTSSYSEAGAVDFWRSSLRLPPAISGHNNYWLWGWGGAGDGPIIAVGLPPRLLEDLFSDVRPAGHLGSPGKLLDGEERGAPIAVCRHPRRPWARMWPSLRAYE